jgi:F-type H+-transporting ATPase subunit epsilon
MDNIRIEVVTPEREVVSEEAQIVMAPGSLGEFGVLTGHTPFLTTLKTGAIKYTDANGKEREVFVSSGFAEALPDRVTVLAESAERRRDIDEERAKASFARAEKRIEGAGAEEKVDFARAKAALERALHRIRMIETKGN